METWLPLVMGFILGCMCAVIAKSRGRSPLVWFFIGLLLGWIGVLALFILPALKGTAEEEKNQEEPLLPPVLNPEPGIEKSTDWFYLDQHKTVQGPCEVEELKTVWKQGSLSPESWVWNETIVDWKKIRQVKALSDWLQK